MLENYLRFYVELTRDTKEKKRKMRSDYGLYSVAVICFILAAVFAAGLVSGYTLSETQGVAVTVVFLLIGIIAAAVGYSARPKAMMRAAEPMPVPTPIAPIEESPPAAEEPTEPVPPPPPPTPLEEVQATPEPSEPSIPTVVTSEAEVVQTQPAPAEAPEEATTEKPKPTRRRRKRAAA